MAKKKKVEPKEELDTEDLDDEAFEDEEIEIAYPEITPSKKKKSKIKEEIEETVITDDEVEEDLEYIPEEAEVLEYKYLDIGLSKGMGKNDYELTVIGQSHGFCNIFVKHLLKTEGINIAAYKVTGIEPSKIFIRIDDGYKIKDVLYKGIHSLREEVEEVQKLFHKLM